MRQIQVTDMEPIKLSEKEIPDGTRILISTACNEYAVIDRQQGKVTRVKVFDKKDFMLAAQDFREGL